MSLFGSDNELGNILQEAVKLKSAQMDQKRKTYQTWPYFVQHTLFHGEKEDYKAWRQLPFDERIKHGEQIKEQGNELYANGQWSDAVDKYEEAPTLVYYCYSTDPGWRKNNRGIDDDVLVLVDDQGSTPEEAKQQQKLRLTCALNLAACKAKLEKYDEVVLACDTVLELDPTNVKALYRRAEARVRPSKSTAYDHDLAIKDLAKANQQDPKNQVVKTLLTRLRAERKVQREKDQGTFEGMFDRGELYRPGDEPTHVPPSSMPEVDMNTIQSRIEGITDDDSLEKRTADAELLRDLYMRNGKEEEAKELHDKISQAKKALHEREEPVKIDWANPTQEMIDDAKKQGLDLLDPLVQQELKRLEREGIGSLPPEGFDDSDELGPDFGLPKVDGPPVPWARYVALFGGIFIAFRLLDAGALRLAFTAVTYLLNGRPRDLDAEDEPRGSLFAVAYRKLFGAGEMEDGEL